LTEMKTMNKSITLKTSIIGIDSDGEEIEIFPETYMVDGTFLYHDNTGQWLDIRTPMGKDYDGFLDSINKVEE